MTKWVSHANGMNGAARESMFCIAIDLEICGKEKKNCQVNELGNVRVFTQKKNAVGPIKQTQKVKRKINKIRVSRSVQ